MSSLRKTISSNLGELADKDILEYVTKMNKKGINDSKLIKQCIRFYRDYSSKVKQLDEIDLANILESEELNNKITNIVSEIIKNNSTNVTNNTEKTVEKKTKRSYNRKSSVNKDVVENKTSNKTIVDNTLDIEQPTRINTNDEQEYIDKVKNGIKDTSK